MVTKTFKKLAKWENLWKTCSSHFCSKYMINNCHTCQIWKRPTKSFRSQSAATFDVKMVSIYLMIAVHYFKFRIAHPVFFFLELPLNGWKPSAKQSSKNFATVSTACLSCCVDSKQQFNIIMVYGFLNKYFSFILFSLFFFSTGRWFQHIPWSKFSLKVAPESLSEYLETCHTSSSIPDIQIKVKVNSLFSWNFKKSFGCAARLNI